MTKRERADYVMGRYWKCRARGECIDCCAKITEVNPRTGELYAKCKTHRDRSNTWAFNAFNNCAFKRKRRRETIRLASQRFRDRHN